MSYIIFNKKISEQKPNTIRNKKVECPFCKRDKLARALAQNGECLLIENKYPAIKDTDMYVLIESATCEQNIFTYSSEQYAEILTFVITNWLKMKKQAKYQDVVLLKNCGPLSGGSIKHEHMQILAFKKQSVYQQLEIKHLLGLEVLTDDITIRISDFPLNNYLEINLEFTLKQIQKLAIYLQITIKYLASIYKLEEFSYNLFFYEMKGRLFVKLVSRYAMSPIFLGFKLQQCYDQEQLLEFKDDLLEYIETNR